VEFLSPLSLGSVLAAGELATAFGMTGWHDGEALEAWAFDQWMEGSVHQSLFKQLCLSSTQADRSLPP
jgi:hypothetical protein